MPVLSVITINLNNALGLRRTIESVLVQTYTDYEYIIIDGGSSDSSLDVIKQYADKISYWISEPDEGIYHAMNKGIIQAHGEYLQFLNSGDWLVDNKTLLKVFEEPQTADIIYGDIFLSLPDGKSILQKSLSESELTLANFYSNTRPTIQHPASFIRKSLFEKGLYDESYKIIADIKFFIKSIIFENCSVSYLPGAIAYFNLEGLSSQPSNWTKTIEERNRIFNELLKPRIMRDYEVYLKVKDSVLLEYIPFLETTTGLNKMITSLVKKMIRFYKIFKFNVK